MENAVVVGDDSILNEMLADTANSTLKEQLAAESRKGSMSNVMSQGDFVSYTWPNLLYQVKEIAKENYFKANQVVLIILSLLIYTIVTTVLAIKLV